MYKRYTSSLLAVLALLLLSFSSIYAQGDNSVDPLVNLALVDGAVVSGSVAEEDAGGKDPMDILWDPSANDWATVSNYHEYGQAFGLAQGGITKENPMWWKVEWDSPKNINYITCTGVYGNQPQPTTGWAVQIKVEGEWKDLAKASNGWPADTLRGVGVGVKTQTSWPWDGQLVWKGIDPVVTDGVRFTIYANPDSLLDTVATAADSVISFSWTGRQLGPGKPKAALIQYLDYTDAVPDNGSMDEMINLALLPEAVCSASFVESTFANERGTPYTILFDNIRGDYANKNTAWGEFGYGYGFEVGYPEEGQYNGEPDDAFYWQVEWPVAKNINYFSWGGTYTNQLQPDTPWGVKYWDGVNWVTIAEGIGGEWIGCAGGDCSGLDGVTGAPYDTLWPYSLGVGGEARSILQLDEPIQTTKLRLEVWSDGITPLWSYHIRARGGASSSNDDLATDFKAVVVGYGEYDNPTAIGTSALSKPAEFALHQNYPNPFNPSTKIDFTLDKKQKVRLSIYNTLGQEVKVLINSERPAGLNTINFDASEFSGGIYFYKLKTNQTVATRKMLFIK